MKSFRTLITLVLCVAAGKMFAINYTSTGSGPWETTTTWSPAGTPTLADNVTINAGHAITVTTAGYAKCQHLVVNGQLKWNANVVIQVNGNYTIASGALEYGVGQIQFNSAAAGTTVTALGTTSAYVYYAFYGNRTITAGSTINKTSTTTKIMDNKTLTNLGTYTMGAMDARSGSTFTNGTNATLTLRYTGFMAGRTFNAHASGNTVTLIYNGGTIPITSAGFYDLKIQSINGTKTLQSNTTINRNITINSGNTLSMNNFNLTVKGNWSSAGSFISSTGKVLTFDGTTAQTISNTNGTTTIKQLTINNTNGVTLTTGTYQLDEVLTVTAGTFNTGGRPFTMKSDASTTARIAPLGATGAITGNFTIQRFITARDTTFADLCSPVQNSTFSDWDNEIAISYSSSPPYIEASAASYDEMADAYVPVTTAGTALNPGQGYEVFLTGDFSYASLPNTTMNTIGIPNQGDFDLSGSVSNTVQGWNLVGNPFASSISWASVYTASGGAASGMYDYIEMFDYTINDWNGYTSADAIEVGSTQGFWVYGLSGPMTLIIPESSKTTSSNSTIKAAQKLQPYFVLKMSNTASKEAHLFKIAATSDGIDALDNKDIPFRASKCKATPQLYCKLEGKNININNFSLENSTYTLPLKSKVSVAGKYRIDPSGFEFISEYTCVRLQDRLTGEIIDLTDGNGYCFTADPTDSPDRFILLLSKDAANCKTYASVPATVGSDFANGVEILPTSFGNTVNFDLSETTNTTISVVNTLGQAIAESINVDARDQRVNVSLPEGYSGMYIIHIESQKGAITKKFVKK